ncbi:MAG: MBL fold metallo-hydrolase [Sandarakinorhabdus sp.]|nr:MBL fold metallo-hydrolase [Sandarakinorhabdus sp.]
MDRPRRWGGLLLLSLAFAAPARAAQPPFAPWNAGLTAEPAFQVQRIDSDSFVIRQSITTNFEAPFIYLLFGRTGALLLDSGAGGVAVRPTIEAIIADWCAKRNRAAIPLVVAHSHSHGDHHQGDSEFSGRADTTVVGLDPAAVAAFFGVAEWPRTIGHHDLGGRILDIIPTPGHEPAHIMVFDSRTRLLLSGDSLYPGRLYVPIDQFPAYRASIDRAVAFTRGRHVRYVLGAHIEMRRTPREDYAREAPVHRDEHELELPYARLLELQVALRSVRGEPMRDTHDDFIIVPRWPH